MRASLHLSLPDLPTQTPNQPTSTPPTHPSDLAATNVGTPYYMSPELVNHQAYAEGADMWSVGCLLVHATAHCMNTRNQSKPGCGLASLSPSQLNSHPDAPN